MAVHCNHQAEEDRGNECLKEVIPAKAMRLSGDKVNAYKGINAVDPGQRTIATMWIPTTGAFFSERKKNKELSRAQRALDYMRADEHAYKTISITSWHTQARPRICSNHWSSHTRKCTHGRTDGHL